MPTHPPNYDFKNRYKPGNELNALSLNRIFYRLCGSLEFLPLYFLLILRFSRVHFLTLDHSNFLTCSHVLNLKSKFQGAWHSPLRANHYIVSRLIPKVVSHGCCVFTSTFPTSFDLESLPVQNNEAPWNNDIMINVPFFNWTFMLKNEFQWLEWSRVNWNTNIRLTKSLLNIFIHGNVTNSLKIMAKYFQVVSLFKPCSFIGNKE